MDYNWNIKDLKRKLQTLKRIKPQTKEERAFLIEDIKHLNKAIELFQDNHSNQNGTLSIKSLIKIDSCGLSPFSFFWKDFQKFQKSFCYNFTGFENSAKIDISKDDCLSLTHDFYRDAIGGDLYKLFLEDFKQRNNHLRFINNPGWNGQALHIITLKESFIEVCWKDTYLVLPTLIHEYGHCIHFKLNYDQQMTPLLFPFFEIISSFMEFLSFSYFYENQILPEESVKEKVRRWDFLKDLIDQFVIKIKMLEILRNENIFDHSDENVLDHKELMHLASKKSGYSKTSLEDVLRLESFSVFYYATAAMFFIELLYYYNEDKEKALYLIKKMLNIKTKDPQVLYEKILQLGIHPGEHSRNFEKQLKRELKF